MPLRAGTLPAARDATSSSPPQTATVPTATTLFSAIFRRQPLQPMVVTNNTGKRLFTGFQPLQRTQTALLDQVQLMWASSTWQSRRNNFSRMTAFAQQHGLDPIRNIDYAGALWVQSLRATMSPIPSKYR